MIKKLAVRLMYASPFLFLAAGVVCCNIAAFQVVMSWIDGDEVDVGIFLGYALFVGAITVIFAVVAVMAYVQNIVFGRSMEP